MRGGQGVQHRHGPARPAPRHGGRAPHKHSAARGGRADAARVPMRRGGADAGRGAGQAGSEDDDNMVSRRPVL